MKNVFKTVKPYVIKHEPELLMVSGITGLVTSIGFTVKATIKAVKSVEKKKTELNKERLTTKEIVSSTWKHYIPVVVLSGISIPCIILGNRLSSRRNAALMAAYTIAETSLQEYKEKTKEIVGEKKAAEIHNSISKDVVSNTDKNSAIILTGNGDSLFYEPISGRYFKSNWNKILSEANRLNAAAIGGEDIITLTDWFSALGLEKTNISDALGWSTYKNGVHGLLKISIDATLTPNNEPCGAIYYDTDPYNIS